MSAKGLSENIPAQPVEKHFITWLHSELIRKMLTPSRLQAESAGMMANQVGNFEMLVSF